MSTISDVKGMLDFLTGERVFKLTASDVVSFRSLARALTEPIPWELAVDIGRSGLISYWSDIAPNFGRTLSVLPPVEALSPPGKEDTDTIRLVRAGSHLFQDRIVDIVSPNDFNDGDRLDWMIDGRFFNSVVLRGIKDLLRIEDSGYYSRNHEPDWILGFPYGDDFKLLDKLAPRKSLTDPNRLSYRDIPDIDPRHRIVTTPGRFLTKFFSHVFDKPRIATLAAAFNSGDGTLKFARSEEEIIKVYRNGPSSCMAHSASEYQGSKHPVAVYASPDLGVAYLDRQGNITARALVRYNKEGNPYVFGRIYGDSTRFYPALIAAGLRNDEDGDGFAGARLVKIHNRGYNYIMPYVDGYGVSEGCPQYFLMAEDGWEDYAAKKTSGLLFEDNSVWSDIEEAYIDENEAVSYNGGYVSRDWADENLVWSDRENEYIHAEEAVDINVYCRWDSSGYVSESVSPGFRDENAFFCDKTGEWWFDGDFVSIEIESLGETWSSWAVDKYGNPDDEEHNEEQNDLPNSLNTLTKGLLAGDKADLRECVLAYMEQANKEFPAIRRSHPSLNIGDIVFCRYSPGNSKYAIVADYNEDIFGSVVLYFPNCKRYEGHNGNNRGLFNGQHVGHWNVTTSDKPEVVIPVRYVPEVYAAIKPMEVETKGDDKAVVHLVA